MSNQRQFLKSITCVNGLVQDAIATDGFDVLAADDLPSLTTLAVTSFNGRLGAVTFLDSDLPATGVIPGTFTLATITVDANGRLSTASATILASYITSTGSSITVSGTTPANVDLNLGHANTWTTTQTIDLPSDAKALVLQEHSSQTANLLEIQDSSGNSRAYIGYDDPLAANSDSRMFGLRPGTRTYSFGTYDAGGAFLFVRSDTSNGFKVVPESGTVTFRVATASTPLLYVLGDYGLCLSGSEAGNAGLIQFGRRPSDSSASVGVTAEFWPYTGQTTPAICTVKPGGGNGGASPIQYRFYVDVEGDIYNKYESSTTNARTRFSLVTTWATSTDASRKARASLSVYDTAAREALRMEADGARAWAGVPAGNSSSFAKLGGPIFDHHADAGNTNTNGTDDDLYSDTTPASVLGTNDEKLSAWYAGVFVSSATATRQIKIWFAGTAIFDTGALTLSLSAAWTCYVEIIRVSATVARYAISMTTEGAALAAYTAAGELTGLTLSGTNILKITGAAAGVGAAASDVLAKAGSVSWGPAA